MKQTSYRVAKLNCLQLGPYGRPHERLSPTVNEWLIVERTKSFGGLLFISDMVIAADNTDGKASTELCPQHTIVALLAESARSSAGEIYLMTRQAPLGLEIPGTFFPVDGCAELTGVDGSFQLFAYGRHAHRRVVRDGELTLHDICVSTEATAAVINWHFDALQRPWSAAT